MRLMLHSVEEPQRMDQADKSFRAAAEECRRLAAKTTSPVEKQELQRIADSWLRLAQLAGGVSKGSAADRSDLTSI